MPSSSTSPLPLVVFGFRIVGNEFDTTVTCAVVGSIRRDWRTTTLPKLNGPATAGTTTDIPNEPPLYGPVRYALPVFARGLGPGPDSASTVPICDASGHVPAFACASPQSGTPLRFATKPGGKSTLSPPSSWSVSSRENDATNGEYPPACRFVSAAVNAGLNPLTQPVVIGKEANGSASGPESGADHGSRSLVV